MCDLTPSYQNAAVAAVKPTIPGTHACQTQPVDLSNSNVTLVKLQRRICQLPARLSTVIVELVALERRVAHVTSQTHTPKRQAHVSGTHVGYAIRLRIPDTHAEATVFAHAPSMTRAVAGRAVGQLDYFEKTNQSHEMSV